MLWTDYYEVIDFDKELKKYKVSGKYAYGEYSEVYENLADSVSDAQKQLLLFRSEFKKSLKANNQPIKQQAV